MTRKVINPNTPQLWDERLFTTDKELLESPFYVDKMGRILTFLSGRRGKFLDIGFGMGNLEKELVKNNTKLEIYGTDFSPKAVENAKKKLKGRFLVARSQKLPFKKALFDFVAMLDVLEHIPMEESHKTLMEVNRVMKKGGYFTISVPLNEDLKKMNKAGVNYNQHLVEYTPNLLAQKLRSSGFNIVKQEFIYAFRNFYYLKSFIMKIFPDFRKPNLLIVYAVKK